jgi:hypothetical protein
MMSGLFQLGAERKVTFDHGKDGSIAEDCYFSMIAFRDGYSFDFIEGKGARPGPRAKMARSRFRRNAREESVHLLGLSSATQAMASGHFSHRAQPRNSHQE